MLIFYIKQSAFLFRSNQKKAKFAWSKPVGKITLKNLILSI